MKANHEAGRAAYVAAEVAKGVSEDEANYWYSESDPALCAAELAAESGWLRAAETGTPDTWADEDSTRRQFY